MADGRCARASGRLPHGSSQPCTRADDDRNRRTPTADRRGTPMTDTTLVDLESTVDAHLAGYCEPDAERRLELLTARVGARRPARRPALRRHRSRRHRRPGRRRARALPGAHVPAHDRGRRPPRPRPLRLGARGADGTVAVAGTDFVTLADRRPLTTIVGFFGDLPPSADGRGGGRGATARRGAPVRNDPLARSAGVVRAQDSAGAGWEGRPTGTRPGRRRPGRRRRSGRWACSRCSRRGAAPGDGRPTAPAPVAPPARRDPVRVEVLGEQVTRTRARAPSRRTRTGPAPPTTTTTETPPTAAPAPLRAGRRPWRRPAVTTSCADALAYLAAHQAPGFTDLCADGSAFGHLGVTCVNQPGMCEGQRYIHIACRRRSST